MKEVCEALEKLKKSCATKSKLWIFYAVIILIIVVSVIAKLATTKAD